MTNIFIYSIVSVVIVSLISLLGISVILFKQESIKKFLLFMVSFAAGALLGDVFIHLLPELAEDGGFDLSVSVYILSGILLFFILEKILHWRHCHLSATKSHTHPLAFMNLIGDALHNFMDGMMIAASYMISIPVGVATTIAVMLHEIPQEMGDFGILLHSGMKTGKALLFNFLSALTAILGALLVLIIGVNGLNITEILVPITAGGFLYIANADLIPELHKDTEIRNSVIQLLSFIVGVFVMYTLLFLEF
jgi:zinc and cadmium transporter